MLVNEENFFQSWQLKRNRALIAGVVRDYLDNPRGNSGRAITFSWDGREYSTTADVILVRQRIQQ